MRKYLYFFMFAMICSKISFSQTTNVVSTYNNFTFFFIDNSAGSDNEPMSDQLVNTLKINLNKLKGRTDNFLLFFASNGSNYKTEYNLNKLTDPKSQLLSKYFSKPSKPCDYSIDKRLIRDLLIENPVAIRQSVEINLYLSSNAVRQALNNIDELPVPFMLTKELLNYLNGDNYRVRINIYTDTFDYGTDIKKNFMFCNDELNVNFPTTVYIL